MSKAKPSYSEAITELESILSELEQNNDINMDLISEKVKRAAVLMEICKKQLHTLDAEMEKILENIES